MSKMFYGEGLPNIDLSRSKGKLIVIEGSDGSGRSTQMLRLTPWLEQKGYYVVNVGIKRSTLVSEELSQAQLSNNLTATTMSLFYATDFADQLENKIIPALMAGAIVLCDRYIYTLMVRDLVRGATAEWVEKLYGFAIKPDLVFYLQVNPKILVERNLEKNSSLNYWESGMDLGISNFIFDSFMIYQKMITKEFIKMKGKYNFQIINGNKSVKSITKSMQNKLETLLTEG